VYYLFLADISAWLKEKAIPSGMTFSLVDD
jgi:hypothetical protein